MTIPQFRKVVLEYYTTHGRHALPWRTMVRGTYDPYRILVSEIMLQQTQVDRVVPYFTRWMKEYPTVAKLAQAPLKEILIAWQGLGYNRRAKMLHQAANTIVDVYAGMMPASIKELEGLPGVGPYTARAVAAFAYNQDVVFVETNIRTAVIHHFFSNQTNISDTDITSILQKALPSGAAREWYAALMDYGAHLKRSGIQLNARSKGYAKQSAFKGSNREVRGAILRALAGGSATSRALTTAVGRDREAQVEEQIQALLTEGLIQSTGRSYTLPS